MSLNSPTLSFTKTLLTTLTEITATVSPGSSIFPLLSISFEQDHPLGVIIYSSVYLSYWLSSPQFSRLVVSDSLRSHEPMPGLPVHHQPLYTQTHVHWVGDAIQSSHSLSSPSPALNLSQHQSLLQWVSCSHQVAKELVFQLQHQSFQWTPSTELLQDGLVGSPCCPRDSQESSPTPQHQFFSPQLSLQSYLMIILMRTEAPSLWVTVYHSTTSPNTDWDHDVHV